MDIKTSVMNAYAGGRGVTWDANETLYNLERQEDPHRVVFPSWQ
jgi:hypothetical protein